MQFTFATWNVNNRNLRPSHLALLQHVQPQLLAEISQARPQGPLAVSHLRGNGRQRTPCRYNFIYVSPDMAVKDVNYRLVKLVMTHYM
jgi:hypothetical protein